MRHSEKLITSPGMTYNQELCDDRMASSGMLRRVALVRIGVSEEISSSIIRVTRSGELRTLAVISNQRKLRRNTK
jgi:hypothetical protein